MKKKSEVISRVVILHYVQQSHRVRDTHFFTDRSLNRQAVKMFFTNPSENKFNRKQFKPKIKSPWSLTSLLIYSIGFYLSALSPELRGPPTWSRVSPSLSITCLFFSGPVCFPAEQKVSLKGWVTFFLGCFIWTRMEMIRRTRTMPDETPITVPWVLVIWWKSPFDLFSAVGKGDERGKNKKHKIKKKYVQKEY